MHHENSLDDLPKRIDTAPVRTRFEDIKSKEAELDRQVHENFSQARRKAWQKPTAGMDLHSLYATCALHLGSQKWREEHPEEFANLLLKATAASAQKPRTAKQLEHLLYITQKLPRSAKQLKHASQMGSKLNGKFIHLAIAVSSTLPRTEKQLAAFQKALLKAHSLPKTEKQKESARQACRRFAGKIYVHQEGAKNIRISPEQLPVFLALGYELGRDVDYTKMHAGREKWQKEHPEEHTASIEKAAKAGHLVQIQNAQARYEERFALIRQRIPANGIRGFAELVPQCPQLTVNQIQYVLKRAVEQGDLIRKRLSRSHTRYYLPAQKKT